MKLLCGSILVHSMELVCKSFYTPINLIAIEDILEVILLQCSLTPVHHSIVVFDHCSVRRTEEMISRNVLRNQNFIRLHQCTLFNYKTLGCASKYTSRKHYTLSTPRWSNKVPNTPSSPNTSEKMTEHLQEASKYVANSFISSFADSLAFYVVIFGGVSLCGYLTYRYVKSLVLDPYVKMKDSTQEKYNTLSESISNKKANLQEKFQELNKKTKSFKDELVESTKVLTQFPSLNKESNDVKAPEKSVEIGNEGESLTSRAKSWGKRLKERVQGKKED